MVASEQGDKVRAVVEGDEAGDGHKNGALRGQAEARCCWSVPQGKGER